MINIQRRSKYIFKMAAMVTNLDVYTSPLEQYLILYVLYTNFDPFFKITTMTAILHVMIIVDTRQTTVKCYRDLTAASGGGGVFFG